MQQLGGNKLLQNHLANEYMPEKQGIIAHHIIYVDIMPQNLLKGQPGPDGLRSRVVGSRTLVYKVASKSNTSGYNTITTSTTPTGGQCKIVLSGGMRIWRNSASSLTYRTTLNIDRGEWKMKVLAGSLI